MYRKYLETFLDALSRVSFVCKDTDGNPRKASAYEEGIYWLVECFLSIKNSEKKVFFIGNGGSSAIAGHMTADFMKNGKIKTCSLYDNAVTTCIGNDYGYEYVFSRPLDMLMDKNDLLVAVSSSGNSQNIVNAVDTAIKRGGKVITLSGFEADNRICARGDVNVHVPISQYGIVESIHNLILQQVVDEILEQVNVKV